MSKSRRKKTPGPWKNKKYEATPPGGLEKGFAKRRQKFGRYGHLSKEKSQPSGFGEGFSEMIAACVGSRNPVSEVIVRKDYWRIIFASGAAPIPSGDLEKSPRASQQKCESGHGKEMIREAVRERQIKRLFEINGWRSKTLEE